jgi:hypothetical protein
METINLKEEVRSLIDQLPENFTWSDLISAIYLRQAMKSAPIQLKGIKQGKNIQLSDLDLMQVLKSDYLRQVLKSEPIQVKGIKQGKNIQLSEKFNIPDGSEVLIEVREVSPVNPEEKLKRMKEFQEFLTAWLDENREEGQKIGEFLESDRTTNRKSSMMPPKKRRAPLFGSDRDLSLISDDFDDPLELLASPLVDRLLEKAKELTKVSAELAEIIAKVEKDRHIDKPDNFWEALQKFRQENNLEAAGIEPEVFEGVRDSSPGREVIL